MQPKFTTISKGQRKDAANTTPCLNCGKMMKVYPSYLKSHAKQKQYCSKDCEVIGRTRPVEEIFWSHVDKSGGPDACWLWTAGQNRGRGQFHPHGQKQPVLAHIFAWKIVHPDEEIPLGWWILHTCPGGDNPLCCNPKHLRCDTPSANLRDTWERGRSRENDGTKLNWEKARAVRRGLLDGISHAQIAGKFGVERVTVTRINLNELWHDDDWEPIHNNKRNQKLSDEQIAEIVRLISRAPKGQIITTCRELADKYGVYERTVYKQYLRSGVFSEGTEPLCTKEDLLDWLLQHARNMEKGSKPD